MMVLEVAGLEFSPSPGFFKSNFKTVKMFECSCLNEICSKLYFIIDIL